MEQIQFTWDATWNKRATQKLYHQAIFPVNLRRGKMDKADLGNDFVFGYLPLHMGYTKILLIVCGTPRLALTSSRSLRFSYWPSGSLMPSYLFLLTGCCKMMLDVNNRCTFMISNRLPMAAVCTLVYFLFVVGLGYQLFLIKQQGVMWYTWWNVVKTHMTSSRLHLRMYTRMSHRGDQIWHHCQQYLLLWKCTHNDYLSRQSQAMVNP